ncbi:glycoside hydrolase family 10 protein [Coleofasciculus sp.]|uniref:glycoside hydrolase family 10 protein n=1 Tax=Coleofasciculus sp. TaxID=3100458 RepID=UPI0039FB19F7
MKKWVVGTAIAATINTLLGLPGALAQTVNLGVVKSPDNQADWSDITSRLQSTGVNYCVIDLSQVDQLSNLENTQLLFLPNIERLEPEHLATVQEWMRQGGRIIVSGPAGIVSQPEVRNRLRSLLGAYWGFGLSTPSKLERLSVSSPRWIPNAGLVEELQGGVVIPASLEAQTAAVWNQPENPPAVVTTDQSIFFGWRWGVDGEAAAQTDVVWLQAALSRYNITPTPGKMPNSSPPNCVKSQSLAATPVPVISRDPKRQDNLSASNPTPVPSEGDRLVLPAQTPGNNRGILTPNEVTAMSRELEHLMGRVESTLLTANAHNSEVGLLTQESIESLEGVSVKEAEHETQRNSHPNRTTVSALAQARIGLQNFLGAVEQQDYTAARQQWINARRLLWDNYPMDRQLAQPEIRAIWLDRGTIVKAKTKQDLVKLFDQLAKAGFNTVFFETVNASYPIYPSQVAPEQNPLVRGWDPLEAAVDLAHERGMELHAWVWIFAAANQRHNALLNQPPDYPGPVLSAHPDWAIFDKRGRLFDPNTRKAFFDPANPEVRDYLMALLEEIANRYDVDGIQLDYIRYPFQDPRVNQTYGYGVAARQQFKEWTGVDPIEVYPSSRQLWQQWTDFRIRQVDSFVASVSARLREQRPDLILSAAVFALPLGERQQRLQQNWEEWALQGYIDLVVPMTYALDTEGLHSLAQPLLTESTLNEALLIPGIRLLNLPDVVAVDQIQLLRDLPAGGYAVFAVENLNDNLHRIFQQTQGQPESTSTEPIPYRQPFPVAMTRFAALQREWNFLVTNEQIAIHQDAFTEWVAQTEKLNQALNQLAMEPSQQHWQNAKAALAAFRSQFPQWMQQQGIRHPYQVQVWDNRLATIERLLNYGGRTTLPENSSDAIKR